MRSEGPVVGEIYRDNGNDAVYLVVGVDSTRGIRCYGVRWCSPINDGIIYWFSHDTCAHDRLVQGAELNDLLLSGFEDK